MHLKKKLAIVLSSALVVGALSGCTSTSSSSTNSPASGSTELVATYSQGSLNYGEFTDALISRSGMLMMLDMVDKAILDDVEPATDDMKANVEANIENIRGYYGDNFEDSLKINGFKNEDDFRSSLLLNEQRNMYSINYIIKNNVSDEEIQAYYDEYSPNIEASHILISPAEETEAALNEAKKEAEDLIARIENGEDFAELAKEYSDDLGSGQNGGELGSFGKGRMVPEFEAAAFALETGEYTKEPVQTDFGYHIILKTAGEEKETLEEMKASIQNTLAIQKLEADQSLSFKALVELRSENGFEISDPLISDQYEIFKSQVSQE